MEETDQLKRDLKRIRLGIGIALAIIIAAFAAKCLVLLAWTPALAAKFSENRPGLPTPPVLDLFGGSSGTLSVVIVVLGLGGVLVALLGRERWWTIPVSVAVAVLIATVSALLCVGHYSALMMMVLSR
ncbi:MAG: hypothetical protein HOH74_30455 [Gemmatimonadetes bacterium]|nr:hypothetical protein [Gemmatimonadota bacterium]